MQRIGKFGSMMIKYYKPKWLYPEAYAFARYFSTQLLLFGWWLPFREAVRSQLTVSETDQGVGIPSGSNFFLLNLFFAIVSWLGSSFGYSFFILGVEWGYMIIPFLHEICILGSVVTLTVFAWKIWYVPGILLLVPCLFYLISVYMMGQFAYYNGPNVPSDFFFELFRSTLTQPKKMKKSKGDTYSMADARPARVGIRLPSN